MPSSWAAAPAATSAPSASQNGLKTALVEEAELGGTCLNRGCIPTKTLLHSADIYHDAKNGAPFGVSADNVTFDYAKSSSGRTPSPSS